MSIASLAHWRESSGQPDAERRRLEAPASCARPDTPMSFRDYPGLFPGLAISVLIGLAVSGRLGQALGTSRTLAWAIVVSAGLALSATVTPSAEALRFGAEGSGVCDLSRLALAPLGDILRFKDAGENVLLFLPLGLTIGLSSRSRLKLLIVAMAVALPFAIEWIQLAATSLGRQCQSADAIDNLTGLVIGIVCGALAAIVLRETTPDKSIDQESDPH